MGEPPTAVSPASTIRRGRYRCRQSPVAVNGTAMTGGRSLRHRCQAPRGLGLGQRHHDAERCQVAGTEMNSPRAYRGSTRDMDLAPVTSGAPVAGAQLGPPPRRGATPSGLGPRCPGLPSRHARRGCRDMPHTPSPRGPTTAAVGHRVAQAGTGSLRPEPARPPGRHLPPRDPRSLRHPRPPARVRGRSPCASASSAAAG
jgi:hypothetical protein